MGKVLSIFVDESGRFQFPDTNSRFYILGLVLHDQSQPVDSYVADLQRAEDEIGLEGHWKSDLLPRLVSEMRKGGDGFDVAAVL